MTTRTLFLLGGHDLEMACIARLLQQYGLPYSDAQLNWQTALLSHYADELRIHADRPNQTIYGIELHEDIPVPPCYIAIDHHNHRPSRPTSLEQVAALLHHPLDRYLQLVSANDAAYIPGMLKLGATPSEIAAIRQADRKEQGITDEQEQLAEHSLSHGLSRQGDLICVAAETTAFSPICDRLYPYTRLLIHTPKTWAYYGRGIPALVHYFAAEIMTQHMYHGGGENGYFGTADGVYTFEELSHQLTLIPQLTAL